MREPLCMVASQKQAADCHAPWPLPPLAPEPIPVEVGTTRFQRRVRRRQPPCVQRRIWNPWDWPGS